MSRTFRFFLVAALLCAVGWLCFLLDLPVKRLCDAYVKGSIEKYRWLELIVLGFQDFAQYVPIAAIAWAIWQLDRRRGRTVVCRLLLAVFAAGMCANAMKFAVGRLRPFAFDGRSARETWVTFRPGWRDNKQQAFFSGHAAMAMAMGKVLSGFYPPLRPVAYTLAAGCGISRILRDKHWLSDVYVGGLAGLGVGWLFLPSWLRRKQNE